MKKNICIILLLMLVMPNQVFASAETDYILNNIIIPNIYIKQVADIGLSWSTYAEMLQRESDGHWVYGIEPGMENSSGSTFRSYKNNIENKTQITDTMWEKIKLLAYYGYNYTDDKYDHTNIKWYIITQLLIWKETRPKWDIYFTDTLNGNKIEDKFIDEINEIKTLIEKHKDKRNFKSHYYELFKNDSLEIIDYFNSYSVIPNDDLLISRKDEKLLINFNEFGSFNFELFSNFNHLEFEPLILVSETHQNVILAGNLKEIIASYEIDVHAGNITLQKHLNNENNSCLNNSVFRLYDENDTLIETLITNENGFAKSHNLPRFGNYYLKESKKHQECEINTNEYMFLINENINHIEIAAYEPHMKNIKKENDIIETEKEVITLKIPKTGLNVIKMPKLNTYIYLLPNKNDKKKKK